MHLPVITYTKEALSRFGEVISKEWLITNGLGGYASSSIPGVNTRKYHGLLVAALNPPGDRTVCLSKLDEDVIVGNATYRFGANEFQDGFFPEGYTLINQFSISPFPTYIYEAGDLTLEKTIVMPQNRNAVAIIYHLQNEAASEATVRLYPLLTYRYFHTVIDRHRTPLDFKTENKPDAFQVTFQYPPATLVCRVTEGKFVDGAKWIDHLHYRDEAERGEASVDDCFQPGFFELSVAAKSEKEFALTAALSRQSQTAKHALDYIGVNISEVKSTHNREIANRVMLLENFSQFQPEVPMSDWLDWIVLAADSFLVESELGRKAIIAGYHWFEPWGRDTFISLPGLLLVTGKFSSAKNILQNFMHYYEKGLIPNFVADKTGVPAYNTVDGTLWYVNAVLQYLKYTGDYGFVHSDLWDNMKGIIEYHQKGTLFDIRVDSDGLLRHGPRLTWMDAAMESDMFTPRSGKAVEIQALWYNTLKTMEFLANKFQEPQLSAKYASMANQARESFNQKFWNPQKNCLYDVVGDKAVDPSMRPNQIFAVSLDFSMLDRTRNINIIDVVTRELVTPYGLRTLSLDDPKFVGTCSGDRHSRDRAYHNGTIWPWLIGPYISAYLKTREYAPKSRKIALEELIQPLFKLGIDHEGLGSINEIYDCNAPNPPRGCISQAWSVAEPLRAYIEDVLGIRPKYSKEILEN
jgi:predicted glycogen debranching enzyme